MKIQLFAITLYTMLISIQHIHCKESDLLLVKSKDDYKKIIDFLCSEKSELVKEKYSKLKIYQVNNSDSENCIIIATQLAVEAELYDIAMQLQLYYFRKMHSSAEMYCLSGVTYALRTKGSDEEVKQDRLKALQAYTQALKLNSQVCEGKCWIARSQLYDEMGETAKSISDMAEAVKIAKNSTTLSLYAKMLGKANKLDDGLEVINKAIAIVQSDDPNSYFPFLIQGWLYSMNGDKLNAKNSFDKARSLTNDNNVMLEIKSAELNGARYYDLKSK